MQPFSESCLTDRDKLIRNSMGTLNENSSALSQKDRTFGFTIVKPFHPKFEPG
jgi:hypothetical protein